ncbi:MAG: PHP domain-containing protein [Coriobacteriia bacterium]|nr:PHP domain-containing protein [Coriobacteriia bacterium]
MRVLADLHTHTVASGHAYSTVAELAASAAAKGLELIAVTDHGPGCPGGAHPYHFWNLKALPSVLGGVRLLKGVETNLVDSDNGLDLPDEILAQLDYVAVGFHPAGGFDDGDAGRNTRALVRVMENPLVDAVTHPGNGHYPVDVHEVVEAAVRHRVALELNDWTFSGTSSRTQFAEGELEVARLAKAAGAKVVVGSDAHFHLHVGRFDAALAAAEAAGLTEDDVVNTTADRVLAHLLEKRERPRLDAGGEW